MAQDPGGLNDGNGDSEYYNDANNLNPAYMGGGVPSENEGDPQDFKGRMIHPASLAPTQPAPPPEASTAAAPSNDLHPGSMTLAPQDYSLSTEPTQAPAPASPLHPTSPTPAGYDENLNAITKDRKFTQPAEGGPTPVPMPKTYDPDQINSARLAAYKTQGVKHYKDPASGLIVPETNDDGTVRFAAKTGPVQYDAQGQAVQTAQDDHGNRSQVYPDANAPIGPHPDRPGEIYKQNKLSAWQYLGTADEMANSTDPAKQQAAADAQKMIDGHLIKSASEGFKALTGQISKEQNNATAAYQTATKQVNDLDTQVSAIKANPVYSQTEGGLFGMIGTHPTAQAKALQDQAAQLEQQKTGITIPPMPDPKVFSAQRQAAARYHEAFAATASMDGVDAARQEYHDNLVASGLDPTQDPVLQSIAKKREELGIQDPVTPKTSAIASTSPGGDPDLQSDLDSARVDKHNQDIQDANDAKAIKANPDFAPLIAERNAITQEFKDADTPEAQQAAQAKMDDWQKRMQGTSDSFVLKNAFNRAQQSTARLKASQNAMDHPAYGQQFGIKSNLWDRITNLEKSAIGAVTSTLGEGTEGLARLGEAAFNPMAGKSLETPNNPVMHSVANLLMKVPGVISDPNFTENGEAKAGRFVGGVATYIGATLAGVAPAIVLAYGQGFYGQTETARQYFDKQAAATDSLKKQGLNLPGVDRNKTSEESASVKAGVIGGAINSVLALPFEGYGKAISSVFGKAEPSTIAQVMKSAYERGGAQGVANELQGLKAAISKAGVASDKAAAFREATSGALDDVIKEITKTPLQRMASVAQKSAKDAALFGGLQVAQNMVTRTYNPETGLFENVPSSIAQGAILGAAFSGLGEVSSARKATQAKGDIASAIAKNTGDAAPEAPKTGLMGESTIPHDTLSTLTQQESERQQTPVSSVKATVPSANAAALGVVNTAQHPDKIAALDTQIKTIGRQLQAASQAGDNDAINTLVKDLDAAHTQRQQLVAEVTHAQALSKASDSIDAIKTGDSKVDADTQDAARGLVKIATGKTMDHLTAAEQAAINAPTPDGQPRVDTIGKTPVITQATIERLRAIAPDAAHYIEAAHGTEAARRNAILTPPKQHSPSKNSPTSQTSSTTGEAKATGGGAPSPKPELNPDSAPIRALTPEETHRGQILSKVLQGNGVSREVADRYAHGYMTNYGVQDYAGQRAHIVEQFQKEGGQLGKEPEAQAANAALLSGMKSDDAEHVKGKLTELASREYDQAVQSLAKRGEEPITEEAKAKLKGVVSIMVPALEKYRAALGEIEYVKDPMGTGGAVSLPGKTRISIGDIFNRSNLTALTENKGLPEKIIQEEAIHHLISQAVSDILEKSQGKKLNPEAVQEKVGSIFDEIERQSPKLGQLIRESYPDPGADSVKLGHEFLRKGVQNELDGKTTEELSPGLLQRLQKVFEQLREWFNQLADKLRKAKVSEPTVHLVESAISTVTQQINKITADAKGSSPYIKSHELATTGLQSVATAKNGRIEAIEARAGSRSKNVAGTDSQSGMGHPSNLALSAQPDTETTSKLAELDQRRAEEDRAKDRRQQAVMVQSNRLSDLQNVLSSVPEDARPAAEKVLSQVIPGDPTYVNGTNAQKIPATYIAAAPGLVETSHQPNDGFSKNPNYGGENTRDYSKLPNEQNKVRAIAAPGALDEGSIVTDVKSAAEGPSQVAMVIFNGPDGQPRVSLQTAGGNGREMGVNSSPLADQDRLSEEWQRKQANFGLQNIPDGWRGYRLIGTYDLREPGQAKAYQRMVDTLNPHSGIVQDFGTRADIDAETKVPVAQIKHLSLDMSPQQATDALKGLVSESEKLGLDRNLMNAATQNPLQAQVYMQRLLLHSAFHSPSLSDFYFDLRSTSGVSTVKNLVKSATQAALELREKGAGEVADGIGRTLETVAGYVKDGEKLDRAIKRAADQLEMGPNQAIVNQIAEALSQRIEYHPLNKKGVKPIDADATQEAFDSLMHDIARGVSSHSDEGDLLGDARTLSQTVGDSIKDNERRNQEYQTPPDSLNALKQPSLTKRIRTLQNRQREEGLNRWEEQELANLEKANGQSFMDFFDEAKTPDRFSLESQVQNTPSLNKPEQLSLFDPVQKAAENAGQSEIDDAAHEASTSPLNDKPEPTQAQKEAGNYEKGHISIGGLDISVENPQGSERSGTDPDGKPWNRVMNSHYGYLKGTLGADKDHLDVFVKPGTPENFNGNAYVINQINPATGKFDEHKVILGAKNRVEARQTYLAEYDESGSKRIGGMAEMPMATFKEWAHNGDLKQPASEKPASPLSGLNKVSEENSRYGTQASEYLKRNGVTHDLEKSQKEISDILKIGENPGEDYQKELGLPDGSGGDSEGLRVRNSNPLQQEADSKSLTDKAAFEALKLNDSKSLATALGDKNRVSSLIHSLVSQEIPSFDVRGAVIQNPGDFATLCQSIRTPLFESLKVAVLDANGTVLRSQILHVGSLNESVASFQRVLGLLGDNEKRVIISHNHPSGDPSPSNADLRLHQSFVEKSKLVGVEIMDHVITNGRRYYSIENHEIGYLKDPVKAKWENTAREDLIHLNPGDISGVFDLLRNASPSAGHIIYVNTKTAITALERYPQDGATASLELAKMIIRGAAREGAYGVFVDHPPSMPQMDAQMLNARLVRLLESSGVKFWDARWSGLQPGATAHQVGIMEEPIQSQELAKATMQRKASTLEEAATAAKEFAGKLIKNDSTGMEASVSGNTIRKMTQEKSVSKSIAAKIHAMALANIDQLFKNADLIQVHPDKNEDINIASIHRFAAPMIVDSMVYPVKITVKEFNHPKENRIYTVEALDVEKAKPAGIRADDTSAKANAEQSVPQAGFDDKIKALQEKVNAGEPSQPSDDIRSHYTLPDLVDDVKAGRTDGPLKAVNEIVANSNELMKRRRAASEKRKGPRATGKLSIIDSITRAAKAERINPQTAQVLTDFINKLDDRFLENESISLRKGAGGGYYEFGSHLVTLLTDSRDVTHTGIHEFWHSLSRLLPEDELEKMKGDYQRALSDYIQKNPDFYALVGREQLTPEQFKEYQFFAGDKAEQNTRPIYASGEVIGYKIAFTQENYRFKSLDEWVVENLTDEILGKDKANAQTPSTPWQRFVQALKDLFSKLRDTLGFNHYKNFADNVFERPEKMDFEREGPLAKEQALYQPDNAKQSNIRNARPEEDPNQLAFHFKEGDNAADRIKQNIGLVDHLANQFRNIPGVEQDDVRSRARIALVKAAQQYDPSKGNFAPYASQSIRNGLKDLFGEQVRHVSTHLTTLDEMNPATEEPNSANVPDSTQNVEKQATSNDARQVLDKATSRLPAPLQLVIKGLEKGETLETIGRDYLNGASRQQVYNLSKTATAGLRRILGELGIKSVDDAISLNSLKQPDADNQFDPYEAIAALQRLAAAEEPGERTIGSPDLAHGADDPAIMGVDEFRKSTAKPQTVEQWKADAEKMLADDYEGMKQKIIDIGLQPGGSLSAPETMAAKMIVAQELKKAYADPTDKTARNNLQILVNAYRQTGTEQARGMRARVDEFKTPADRHREFLGKMIFSPAPLQAKLNASKTPEERQEILNKDRERLDKIEKALGEMGVSLNDILNGETVMRLKGARFISNALKSFPEKEAEAIKMYQDNKPLTAILKKTGLNKTQMEAAIDKLRTEFLKKHLDKFKAGAKADSVEMDALAARAPGDLKQTVSDAEALAEAMKAFESMGFRPTEKQGKKQFDITKPEDAVEAARAIQAADGNAFDMVREYWINAILSGPVTHTGIFSAVAGRIAWNNTVGRASEALVNSALGVIGQGDKDAAQWGEFKYVMQGLAPALSSAATDALKAFNSETSLFKHRHDPDSKLDDHMFPVSIPGKLGRVIRIPGRVIQTLDEYFKTLTGRLEAGAQAYRMAKGEGLKGDAIQKRVEALIADPHSEAWQRSIASALHDLFQTEIRSHKDGANLVEGMAHGVMSLTKDFTPAQFVIPFVRIGYNILAAGVQSSPLGSIYMAQRFAKDGFYHFAKGKVNPNPYLKSEMIRDLAGQLIAWTAGALLWGAVEGDKDDDKKKLIMTGSESPGDKRSGNRLLAQRRGLPAYTIQYRGADGKDQSFYYGRYEPDATVLGTTVDMIRGLKDHARGATAPDAFIGFLQRMSGQFTEKSYARGLSELANLLSNPKANAYDWVSHIASSFVPNIITQPMRGLDPYERDNHIEAGDTKTLIKQFMAQTVSQALPGMSGQPAKVDAYGRDVVKNGSGIFRVLAPGNPHEQMAVQKADDLLANWKIQSHDDAPESLKDWAPAQPARTFTQGGKKVTMSTQEYHDMKAQAGKIVMQQLAGRITGSMVEKPTLRDVQMIKQAFEAAHRQALEQVKAKHPGAAPDLSRIMWAQ